MRGWNKACHAAWISIVLALVLGGCASKQGAVSFGSDMYPYNAMNDDCSCEHFKIKDPRAPVHYDFSAAYSVDEGITTRIAVTIQNNGKDTLDLSLARVRVASRNVPYHYNNKFVPVTIGAVPPGDERTINLVGSSSGAHDPNPWLRIAGEELVVTLEGIRINDRDLASQTVRFVPRNPKFSEGQ